MAGLSRTDAAGIGVLLNTRGLIEIIVLQVGLAAGIIDRQLFSEMLVMALATTLMTGPLVRRTRFWDRATRDLAPATAIGEPDRQADPVR
jgi:Kef-type K+ transport system membrane component KefB